MLSRNKRRTRDGTPIWYVFIDESGHPYFDPSDMAPFTMAGLITDDPEALASIPLRYESDTARSRKYRKRPGEAEIKHSRSSPEITGGIMGDILDNDITVVAAYQPMYSEFDNPHESGAVTYIGTLSRILNKVAADGPLGIYRIRLDASHFINEKMAMKIARAAFDGSKGRRLAERRAMGIADSDITPALQAADAFVGEYRKSLKTGDKDFVKRNKVMRAERRGKR